MTYAYSALRAEGSTASPLAHGNIVVVSDGRAGHLNQCLGLAAMLGVDDPEIIPLRPTLPYKLSKYLPVAWGYDLTSLSRLESGVVLGAGWQVSRLMHWLKRNRPGVFTVQMMRPSGNLKRYDVVVLPMHDDVGTWVKPSDHVIRTFGMLNRVRAPLLEQEWTRWRDRLERCHEPRLALLLGGDSRHHKVDLEDYDALAESALTWARENKGSLLVSTSGRTPKDVARHIRRKLTHQRHVPVFWWSPDEGEEDNPYYAFLAGCRGAVVTADSLAMLSEVATAGKPLYAWGLTRLAVRKYQRLAALFERQRLLSPWEGRLRETTEGPRLTDVETVADFVRKRYANRSGPSPDTKSEVLLSGLMVIVIFALALLLYLLGSFYRQVSDCPYTGVEKLFLCGKA